MVQIPSLAKSCHTNGENGRRINAVFGRGYKRARDDALTPGKGSNPFSCGTFIAESLSGMTSEFESGDRGSIPLSVKRRWREYVFAFFVSHERPPFFQLIKDLPKGRPFCRGIIDPGIFILGGFAWCILIM